MVDTLTAPADAGPAPLDGLVCEEPGCGRQFVNLAGLASHRNTHKPKAERAERPKADKAPTSIHVNLGSKAAPRKDAELAAVEARALQIAQTAAALVLLTTGSRPDAMAIQGGAEGWAKAVRELAVHEEWLRKLAAGGEPAGRMIAWVNFLMATGAIAVPIMLNHGWLPENVTAMAASVFATGAQMAAEAPGGPPPI